MRYAVIPQEAFGEFGLEAKPVAEFETDVVLATHDILLNVQGAKDQPIAVMQRLVTPNAMGEGKGEIKLIVADVRFGKVSNLTNVQGSRIITS